MIRARRILSRGGAALLGVVSLALVGCGGGDATPTDGGADRILYKGPTAAVAGCNEFATLFCERDKECNASAQDVSDCVRLARIGLSCDLSPATVDFASCLNDVQTSTCDELFNNGSQACSTALNMVPLSNAQTKCQKLAAAICQKSAECQGVTPSPDEFQACVANRYGKLDCALAISVGSTYDQCLLDVANAPCTSPDGGTDGGGGGIPSCEAALGLAN